MSSTFERVGLLAAGGLCVLLAANGALVLYSLDDRSLATGLLLLGAAVVVGAVVLARGR
ncbi:hypothetical protein [Halogeometricum pallidum]|uniref:hypothetical protein n=1 Tax=Halogeometricum pallidum TaxID=411361 RepID=UPI001360B382|nr:hypothetical protein [Halogeometricum pallidum]